MKLFSMSTLLLGIYVVVLATYAWYERELLTVALGILPLLLITIVRAIDRSSEKRPAAIERRPGEYQHRV
jgi:ABC-type antimicrobial peptide transport system permease subunit